MSKRKTQEQFVEDLQKVNSSIEVLGNYETAMTQIEVRCSVCGHLWKTKPNSLLHGSGCPECGKKKIGNSLRKSNEVFVYELHTINPDIEPLEEYKGNRKKILLHCKICGNEWKTAPHDLLSGHGCPRCGYERQKNANRHSKEVFLLLLNQNNPNLVALDEYVNNHTKIRFQCKECGKIWTTVPNSVMLGHGCPKCARSSTSFLEQVMLHSFSLVFGEDGVLSRDRDLIGMELDIVIPSLKIAYEPGSWAWHYNKKTRDQEKRIRCEEKGYRLVFIYTDYQSDSTPFDIDCYTWKTNLGNSNWIETRDYVKKLLLEHGIELQNEQWNEVRSSAIEFSRRKTHDEYVKELHNINRNIKVLSKYNDSSVKVDYECLVCGKKWSALPGSVLSGHGCPACGRRRTMDAIRMTSDQFLLRMEKLNPKVIILGKYVDYKEKLLCGCRNCDNQWEMTPQNLLKGQGCPKCGRVRAANKNRKTHAQFVEELSKKNPKLIVQGKYVDSDTKLEIECGVCGYLWQANPMTVLSGHGCPKCAGTMKKTDEQFRKELEKKLPNVYSIDKYCSANEKISVGCSVCGYKWNSSPHVLLRSKGCPICRRKNVKQTSARNITLRGKNPSSDEAERLVREAEAIYPGPWGDHSRWVAKCAGAIAAACGMDAEKAYVLGLLHDIGRRFGHGHMAHVYDGYTYMLQLGYPDAARICLTHSFNTKVFEDYIGNVDISEEKQRVLRDALAACEFDDYDRLMQLCDSIGTAEGPAPLEARMGDVKRRYGRYPQDKWNRNFELKRYFEEKAGRTLEDLFAEAFAE